MRAKRTQLEWLGIVLGVAKSLITFDKVKFPITQLCAAFIFLKCKFASLVAGVVDGCKR